jgi:hypothetical protein
MSQLEAQRPPYLVRFSERKPHELLTQAMENPQSMAHCHGFLSGSQHLGRIDPASAPSTSQKSLLLGWERSKAAVVYMIAIVVIISVLAGVVSGILAQDASLGFASSSCVAAVLSCVEVIIIWQLRQR